MVTMLSIPLPVLVKTPAGCSALSLIRPKIRAPGRWGYEYRDIEKDAVVGVFSDSDFVGGGTDGKGHKFSVGYAVAKNATLSGTYFMTEKDVDGDGNRDDDYDRLQLDLSG